MQKNQFFSKTYPSNLLKSHKKYPFGSITMSEKDGSAHPPKIFQYGDIEIFSLWRSLTGRNWHACQITPWKGQSDPKTLRLGIIHDNMSCWPTLGPFRHPRGPQKGPFGPKQSLTGRTASERPKGARIGPNCCQLVWLGWNHGYHTLWPDIGPLLGPQKAPFWPLKDPNRAKIKNCHKPIVWLYKPCTRRALSQWKKHFPNQVY